MRKAKELSLPDLASELDATYDHEVATETAYLQQCVLNDVQWMMVAATRCKFKFLPTLACNQPDVFGQHCRPMALHEAP